jgi:hypothetical protein
MIERCKLGMFHAYSLESDRHTNVTGLSIDDDEQLFLLDDDTRCCEEFGVETLLLNNLSGTDFVGYRSMTQSEVEVFFPNVKRERTSQDGMSEYGIEITSETSDKFQVKSYILFWNRHNGFYDHTVYILSKGVKKKEVV